ncbi:MAG: phospholipase D family protein [Deltaproteobacteria bacterium]|nr:phospholipase D family protein [Deltaproteobacteria bacterium]
MGILIQPFSDKSIGDFIQEALNGKYGKFDTFQAFVAFAKRSGVQHIEDELKTFIGNGNIARIVVGVDLGGTTVEGLEALLDALGETGKLLVNHDESTFTTFHPKIYFFEGTDKSILIVGSGNLTQGGLYSNDEGFAIMEFDPSNPDDLMTINQYKKDFGKWCNEDSETVRLVDKNFIEALKEAGYVPSEAFVTVEAADGGGADAAAEEATEEGSENEEPEKKELLFGRMKGRRRPPRKKVKKVKVKIKPQTKPVGTVPETLPEPSIGFVMTLMKTDVGTGQTTPGKARRSPEIFIPLIARNADPDFWGWNSEFTEDPEREGKFDRMGVRMRIGGEVINVNMMTWPVKRDFRLRSEALRSAGEIGDLIKIEKIEGAATFDYYVEIIPQGSSDYDTYLDACVNKTPNSQRVWGYY